MPLHVDTTQLLNSSGDISPTASKDGIILKFRPVNCLSISRPLKQQSKVTAVSLSRIFVVRCAICYRFYNLKNVKNTHGGVLILVKLQAAPQITSL